MEVFVYAIITYNFLIYNQTTNNKQLINIFTSDCPFQMARNIIFFIPITTTA